MRINRAREKTACRRFNIGAGQFPLLYWTNLDEAPDALADIYAHVPPIPAADASLDEIYCGHFLEHLTPTEADAFLVECHRCLVPGGTLGVLVPDTREIMRRYVAGDNSAPIEYPSNTWHSAADLDAVCALFLYSSVQDSPHRWSYDTTTLRRLLERHGFRVTGEIDRWEDRRVAIGAWYQCGLDAVKEL